MGTASLSMFIVNKPPDITKSSGIDEERSLTVHRISEDNLAWRISLCSGVVM
ncbi:hypothetical protein M8C21_015375 [Ambrosia artemisiifolia]|uniref:Uncharacterized protein n=1 Tax=Ambrosia artemisiifolia TaxID=4212 RepID=A0AAD5G8X6_AMBAR|nr:hypothetical protein M8C21_015375 [Ambrosia artemisiifolia]